MMFFVYTAIAAVVFGVCVTRPGMRLLTSVWPKFFDRMDWIFMLGLEEGLYGYSEECGASDEDEQALERSLLYPLMKVNCGVALALSWLSFFFGASTFAAICLAFVGSLLSLGVGFGIVVVGRAMIIARSKEPPLSYDEIHTPLPYSFADRVYDFFADRWEGLTTRAKNPQPVIDFFDGAYDTVKAKVFRRRG